MLLPALQVEALERARAEVRRARTQEVLAEVEEDEEPSTVPAAPDPFDDPQPQEERRMQRQVFDMDAVDAMLQARGKGDREHLQQLKSWWLTTHWKPKGRMTLGSWRSWSVLFSCGRYATCAWMERG